MTVEYDWEWDLLETSLHSEVVSHLELPQEGLTDKQRWEGVVSRRFEFDHVFSSAEVVTTFGLPDKEFIYLWSESCLWDLVFSLRRHYRDGGARNVFCRSMPSRRYITLGAIPDRSHYIERIVLLFKHALRHYRTKGVLMERLTSSFYPWYYDYGSALFLREDAQEKREQMKD